MGLLYNNIIEITVSQKPSYHVCTALGIIIVKNLKGTELNRCKKYGDKIAEQV